MQTEAASLSLQQSYNGPWFLRLFIIYLSIYSFGWSQWPRGLRRGSLAARRLGLWVRIPREAWMCVCCVLSGRGLCDKLITHPEKYYRLWCVVVCDVATSLMSRPWPALGRSANKKKLNNLKTEFELLKFCPEDYYIKH